LQIIWWNVPEWGGISHLYDTRFHHMSRDGGNVVLFHPRVEYSTIFIYSAASGPARVVGSRDVIEHVYDHSIRYVRCSIGTEPLPPTVFEIFGPN